MSNLVIAAPNWSDGVSSITALTEAADRPASNLLLMQPRVRWQSVGNGLHSLALTRATARPLNLVAPLFHNGSEAATWRVIVADNASFANFPSTRTYDSTGGFDACVRLDGLTQLVSVTGSGALNVGTFTLEAQIRPRLLRRQGIVKRTGGSLSAMLTMNADGQIRFLGMPGVVGGLTSPSAIPVREWSHVAGTYDASTQEMHLYVNGALVASATALVAAFDGSGFEIGSVESERFWGEIDDVRFWNVARTPAQIVASYQAEVAVDATLVGYWKFNETGGTTADDASASGNDGTLVNSAEFVFPSKLRVPWGSLTDAGEPADDYDSWPYHHGLMWFPVGVTDRYLRVDILDPNNADGHLRMGRLYGSAAWQPSHNMQWGSDVYGYVDSSPFDDLPSGPRIPMRIPIRGERSFSLRCTDIRQLRENAQELARTLGGSRDCLVIFNPDEPEFLQHDMEYGTLQAQQRAIYEGWSVYALNYTITGLL